jgi:hypothetical protein
VLDTLLVKKAAIYVRAINHKLRQQILKKIDEKGTCTVTEIFTELFFSTGCGIATPGCAEKGWFCKNNP